MATKVERLREFLKQRKESPPEKTYTRKQWGALLEEAELTPDDLSLLDKQVAGHKNRALKAAEAGNDEDFAFESLQALLLDPFDSIFASSVSAQLKRKTWEAEDLSALKSRLTVVEKAKGHYRSFWIPILVGLGVLASLLVAFLWWSPWSVPPEILLPPPVSQSSRDLPVTLDTQGVKVQLTRLQSRIDVYAESAVLHLHVLLEFPDSRVSAWAVTLAVLDANGKPVHQESLDFRTDKDPELQPGQGWQFDRQFDAANWIGAESVVLTTQEIGAVLADKKQLQGLQVAGLDGLAKGYALEVYQRSSVWKELFATHVNQLSLEVHNSGLKAFRKLGFQLDWISADGTKLKSLTLKAVSEFKSELPSGGHIALEPKTSFEAELFSWPSESPPHPVLTLVNWQ